MTLMEDIKPRIGYSAYVEGPFDENLKILKDNGYRLISLEENVGLRIQEGKDAFISKNGNWVREGVLYVPGKGRFITKESPILENPKKATQSHRSGEEYFISDTRVQRALENSIQVPFNISEIPTNRFGEDEIARFCFGENAENYGLFLKDPGIKAMPLWLNPKDYIEGQKKPYANQLWLGRLGDGSGLDGDSGNLGYGGRSRGVK